MVSVSGLPIGSLGHGDTALLLCPVFDPADGAACIDLLTPTDPGRENVLSVTMAQSPRTRLAIWERYAETPPADGSVIVSDQSADGVGFSVEERVDTGDVTLLSVDDTTELGIRIADRLDRWAERADDKRTVVCFHSVSTLLQMVDREEGIRFLRTLAEECSAADATAHYHMDPRAHSTQTVARLRNAVDVVYEYDGGRGYRRGRSQRSSGSATHAAPGAVRSTEKSKRST